MEVKVKDRQSLLDMAVQTAGSMEDVAVAHTLRVVVIRVGNEGLVFHEAQNLVPVPFRTVRDDGQPREPDRRRVPLRGRCVL